MPRTENRNWKIIVKKYSDRKDGFVVFKTISNPNPNFHPFDYNLKVTSVYVYQALRKTVVYVEKR